MRCLAAVLFILMQALALAQYVPDDTVRTEQPRRDRKDPRPFAQRFWFGGGLGLSFGTVTAIQIDPLLGYKVDQEGKFSIGVGGSYWRFQDNRFPTEPFVGYGYRTFARYRIFQPVYVHAEFLHMNAEIYDLFDLTVKRAWVPHLLLGGGYVQSLGGRSSVFLQVLFDVLQHENSIYANRGPIFMGGVGVGF